MPKSLFSEEDRGLIVNSIQAAELVTSGEIQVHIENHCADDVMDRAAEVFELLKMHQTRQRNAVLFYLAVEDHKFAVLGDCGINAVVPPDFWENIKELMITEFKEGNFTQGLIAGIDQCGLQLKAHFPFDKENDTNELSDDISFG
ncbi:TPM domain-containing protein [Mongoliitalea daihaiensis]|uniref:TPM domain-containing protein n=1 Tax=Mongoliitalea daihaiensis TaxID=2782006 RepID=UPI001F445D00|nr:TPM domain-containing protein [Mongoliitalea daihaiensis]UJP65926.1 TPM domain-containing protein [Mongoliitalea daihaiensis]